MNLRAALLFALASALAFTACAKNDSLFIYVVDGPPLLSAASLFYQQPQIVSGRDSRAVEYVTVANRGQLEAAIEMQRPDFAIAPVDFAAATYKTSGDYVFGGITSWGLFHLVENVAHADSDGGLTPIGELPGKTIYAFGMNTSPSLVLETVLAGFNLAINRLEPGAVPRADAVNIRYLESTVQVRDALMGNIAALDDARFGLLTEPLVTALVNQPASPQNNHADFRRAVDLPAAWQELFGSGFPQTGIMVKASLAKSSPALAAAGIALIAGAIDFTLQNPEEAARLAVDELASAALPPRPVTAGFAAGAGQSAFTFQSAEESREAVLRYLEIQNAGNPSGTGGTKIPAESFFFRP